jgi:hypothetical protein
MVFIPHVDKNIAYLDIMGNKGAEGARNLKVRHSRGKGLVGFKGAGCLHCWSGRRIKFSRLPIK